MDTTKLYQSILAALEEYCDAEEIYGDNAYVEVNPADSTAIIVTDEEADVSELDCYPALDLLRLDPDDPSHWEPDTEAVSALIDTL